MNTNQTPTVLSQNEAKYRNARVSLLVIIAFSILNIFTITSSGTYYMISSYISQIVTVVGYSLYLELNQKLFLILFGAIAAALILPYLLCFFFCKRHVGWMIGATVMFSLDTLLLLIDVIPGVLGGDYVILINLAFHIYALVTLIMGIKYGRDMKRDEAAAATASVFSENAAPAESGFDTAYGFDAVRTVTVTRKKSFVAMAIPEVIYVNGQEVCRLQNGKSASFQAPDTEFELGMRLSNGMIVGSTRVPAGEAPVAYEISIKMGAFANTASFTQLS